MGESILTSVADGVASLRLNRAKEMNSLDAATARTIRDAV